MGIFLKQKSLEWLHSVVSRHLSRDSILCKTIELTELFNRFFNYPAVFQIV
jgi:hypothetical protein